MISPDKAGLVTFALLLPGWAWGQPAAPATPAAPDTPPALELRETPKPTLAAEEPLTAHPGGLTADEVAKKAVAASPTLAARQAEIDAAQARVDQAMIQFFPRLTLKATYARISKVPLSLSGGGALLATQGAGNQGIVAVPSDLTDPTAGPYVVQTMNGDPVFAYNLTIPTVQDNYSFAAQLGVPVSDYVLRLSKTMAATRANERAAQLNRQAELLKTATDARIAYYNWTRGVAGLKVAESSLWRIKSLQKDSEAAFSVGAATRADVLRVEALAASTELTITETRNLKQLAQEQLAVLMNEPVRSYVVGENVRTELPTIGQNTPLTGLVQEAFRRRLELKALREADLSLAKAVQVVQVGEYPRLDAFGEYDYARPNRNYLFDPLTWHSNWMVGVTLSYTVNDTFANRASSRELEANRRKLQADAENLKRGLQMEVTSAYLDEQKARVALDTAQRGLKSAQEAYRVAVDLYRVGRATTTDLIAAEQELLSAALREVNAAIDAKLAGIRLVHATGRDATNRNE
jgi:outer membrane protein TolC